MSDTSLLSMTPLIHPASATAEPSCARPRHLGARTARVLDRCTRVAIAISTKLSSRLTAALSSCNAPHDGDADTADATRDRGQATTEYALVMLAAALVALLIVAWATAGGGAGKVGRLFDRILDEVISRV